MYTEVALSPYEIERNKPTPSFNHSIIQANLIYEIKRGYKKRYSIASELSLDLDDWPSVPDISLYAQRPMDLRRDVIEMTEPPLCTIEIISPSQSINDLTAKAYSYFGHGVQSCWLVIPPLASIYVYSSPDDYEIFTLKKDEFLHDSVLDIKIPVAEIFE